MQTKTVLLYVGGALALGAVTYFTWSFFQKVEIPIDESKLTLGNESDAIETKPKTLFTNTFKDFLNTTFAPIKTPKAYSDIRNFPLNQEEVATS